MINKVILVGHIGQEPTLKYTQNKQPVVNLRVATERRWFDKVKNAMQTETEWHTVTVWGKSAEFLSQQSKGAVVYIEGRIATRQWEAKDGSKRYATEVISEFSQLLKEGRPKEVATTEPLPLPTPTDHTLFSNDDVPF